MQKGGSLQIFGCSSTSGSENSGVEIKLYQHILSTFFLWNTFPWLGENIKIRFAILFCNDIIQLQYIRVDDSSSSLSLNKFIIMTMPYKNT